MPSQDKLIRRFNLGLGPTSHRLRGWSSEQITWPGLSWLRCLILNYVLRQQPCSGTYSFFLLGGDALENLSPLLGQELELSVHLAGGFLKRAPVLECFPFLPNYFKLFSLGKFDFKVPELSPPSLAENAESARRVAGPNLPLQHSSPHLVVERSIIVWKETPFCIRLSCDVWRVRRCFLLLGAKAGVFWLVSCIELRRGQRAHGLPRRWNLRGRRMGR
mmetsp:Transcript_42059/g.64464  ORF Transcript_42059/g.64464 Transcript_42059/m.64464 type:complete len:218 (-) Transcript_42059:102-755(-)